MTAPLPSDPNESTTARVDFDVWSTTATLVVTDPAAVGFATVELRAVLAAVDDACSRFRTDSEISSLLARPDREVRLSPVLNAAMAQAIRVAAATDFLVDPTVAAAVISAGYDRDIAAVVARAVTAGQLGRFDTATSAAPGAWQIHHDEATAQLRVPPGVGIDLGATAKAFAADLAAARIVDIVGGGVLVSLGGDIAVAGRPPEGGWRIAIGDDHRATSVTHQLVSITAGGLATSSTVSRRWRTAAGWNHHIIDPRTGRNPDPCWRTVSVAAATCVDANAAATAAIVLGPQAPEWLAARGLPALLIDVHGVPTTVAGWPAAEMAA